jgi:hypothetical protein
MDPGCAKRPPRLAASFISGQVYDVADWHIATFRCGTEFGRYQAIANIG